MLVAPGTCAVVVLLSYASSVATLREMWECERACVRGRGIIEECHKNTVFSVQ